MDHCKVIAVTNQKGGVGKTTTTVNLGIGLARQGKRVLMIDADPQGSLSICLGQKNPDALDVTLTTLMQAVIADKKLPDGNGIYHHPEEIIIIIHHHLFTKKHKERCEKQS